MRRENTALLIIDAQVAMFAEPEPAFQSERLLATLAELIARARAARVPVIFVQHDGDEDDPLKPGAPGWPIHPAIAPAEGEPIVRKQHPDAFQGTSLQSILEDWDIRHLVVAGLQTEYCVDTTCRRAYSLGYEVTLARDAHGTWDTDALKAGQIIAHHNRVLGAWFVRLKDAEKIEF